MLAAGSKKATLRITAFGQGRTELSTIEKDNIEVVYVEPTPSLTSVKQGDRAAGIAGFLFLSCSCFHLGPFLVWSWFGLVVSVARWWWVDG